MGENENKFGKTLLEMNWNAFGNHSITKMDINPCLIKMTKWNERE